MTTAVFVRRDDHFVGFVVKGHSGLAEEGEDVLCAAITSAVRLVECTLTDVLHIKTEVKVEEGLVRLGLPAGKEYRNFHAGQQMVLGLLTYFEELEDEYKENFSVLVVEGTVS